MLLLARLSLQLIHEVQRMKARNRSGRTPDQVLRCIAKTQSLSDFDAQYIRVRVHNLNTQRKFLKRIFDEVEIDFPDAIIRLLIWILY